MERLRESDEVKVCREVKALQLIINYFHYFATCNFDVAAVDYRRLSDNNRYHDKMIN